jgi:hypothetical protein
MFPSFLDNPPILIALACGATAGVPVNVPVSALSFNAASGDAAHRAVDTRLHAEGPCLR